jgi:hypothetical protein
MWMAHSMTTETFFSFSAEELPKDVLSAGAEAALRTEKEHYRAVRRSPWPVDCGIITRFQSERGRRDELMPQADREFTNGKRPGVRVRGS